MNSFDEPRHSNSLFNEFVRHLFPRMIRSKDLKITYTFCLGGMSFTTFIILMITGMLLLFYYRPSVDNAFNSILFIETSVPGGLYVRSLHRLASHALLILIFLHMLRVILTGAFRKPRELNWITGCFLLCFALFEAYSGNFLPMDQAGLWATKTGMELLKIIPFGKIAAEILCPDGAGQPMSLLRFYILHAVLIPLAIIVCSFLHFYHIRQNKGVLPFL